MKSSAFWTPNRGPGGCVAISPRRSCSLRAEPDSKRNPTDSMRVSVSTSNREGPSDPSGASRVRGPLASCALAGRAQQSEHASAMAGVRHRSVDNAPSQEEAEGGRRAFQVREEALQQQVLDLHLGPVFLSERESIAPLTDDRLSEPDVEPGREVFPGRQGGAANALGPDLDDVETHARPRRGLERAEDLPDRDAGSGLCQTGSWLVDLGRL